MLPAHAIENKARIVPIGQKWPLVRRRAGSYRGSGAIGETSQRRFVGDCATCQRRASVAETEDGDEIHSHSRSGWYGNYYGMG